MPGILLDDTEYDLSICTARVGLASIMQRGPGVGLSRLPFKPIYIYNSLIKTLDVYILSSACGF
jgi:hypothetical protein